MMAFLHGYLLAFGLILPLGPQNAFVMSQGAARRRWREALPVVLVASICDTLLILLAVLGVSVVVLTIPWFKLVLVVTGVCFLVYIGWTNWRAAASARDAELASRETLRQQIAFTVAISLLNPHAILDTIGVIGTSALAYHGDDRVAFTLACILNSWLWFAGLSLVGRLVRDVAGIQKWFNRISALVMWSSAAYLLVDLFR